MDVYDDLSKLSRANPSYRNATTSIEEIVDVMKKDFPSAHMMKIEGFTKLFKNGIRKIESSVFELAGFKCQLKIYPYGYGGRRKNYLSLGLNIEDTASLSSKRVAKAKLIFFVQNMFYELAWSSVDRECCFTSRTNLQIEEFLPFDDLLYAVKGYVRNDVTLLGVVILREQYANSRDIGTAECFRLVERPKDSKFTWKITKFSSFDKPFHFSHAFTVGQRKWRIKIYPKGKPDEKGSGGLAVYLTAFEYLNDAPKATTYAKFKLRVLDQLYYQHREQTIEHCFGDPNTEYGYPDFIGHKELHDESKGFLMDDIIYIGVEFDIISYTQYC